MDDITVTTTGWNFIKFRWQRRQRVDIKFYKISYLSESRKNNSIMVNSSKHEIMLQNLTQLTSYHVTVIAGDGKNFGRPQNPPIFVTTTGKHTTSQHSLFKIDLILFVFSLQRQAMNCIGHMNQT